VIKKWFDWTERDIAAWEKLRLSGFWRFMLWYGIGLTGGGLFLLLGVVSLLIWRGNFLPKGVAAGPGFAFLLLRIAFLAGLSLLGGLVNGIVTWVMEEAIYRRIYRKKRVKIRVGDVSHDHWE